MMDRIRVCHISTRFLRGGGTKNTLLTIAGLDPARFEVDLVVGRDVYWPQLEPLRRIRVHHVPAMVREIRPLRDLAAFFAIYRILRERRPHIVHTHIAKAGVLGRWAAAAAGVPIIVHGLHGVTFHPGLVAPVRELYRLIERATAAVTDQFVAVGEDLRRTYLEAGVATAERYSVIRSGMDLSKFRAAAEFSRDAHAAKRAELGLSPGTPVAGYVANLERRKAHEQALAVFARAAERVPESVLLLVGEGNREAAIREEAERLRITDRVRLLGYRRDIAEVMGVFDVKLFTSRWEGLPQVLVQAAAMGIPVIAFETDGVREVVRDGQNGHIVRWGDVDRLAEKLASFLKDPDRARAYGASGKELVDDSWTVEAMVQETAELYERLISESPAMRRLRVA